MGKNELDNRDWAPIIAERQAKWAKMHEELAAEGIERIDIWNGNAPARENGFKSGLYLLPTHMGKPRGTFIVCAGGGFMFKSSNEAKPVAEFFRNAGCNAAILDYNVDPANHDLSDEVRLGACEDGLRAVRYLRANADRLGIRADKIAIGGFSAGGMTTQLVSTRFDYGNSDSDDPVERVSSRPDAALLLYGAFSYTTSVGWLNYDAEAQSKAAKYDPIRNIGLDCPPTFIFQTNMDDPRNGLLYALELAHRGIPHVIHTFSDGPHGAALYNGEKGDTVYFPHTARWAMLAAEWLEDQGFC